MRELLICQEDFSIAGAFAISRGTKTQARVVVCEIEEDGRCGRGECVPYARYGETVDSVSDAIERVKREIFGGADRARLQTLLPAGAARNAIDCALLDLETKLSGKPAHEILDLAAAAPVPTAYTISLDTPERMAQAALRAREYGLLKLKLGGDGDPERVAAVRASAPDAKLIVDANEAWNERSLYPNTGACLKAGVLLIEQPLPQADDELLRGFISPVPLCADESCHTRVSLTDLAGKYQILNLKLDKAGGITECLALAREAKALGFGLMLGCMVSSSLGIAPMMLLAGMADFVDLDGAALLSRDREHGLRYQDGMVYPPDRQLWG